jgi:tetratricopeptide (TPR) repeat protein
MEGQVEVMAGSGIRGQNDGEASKSTFSYPNGIAVSPDSKTLYINDMVTGLYSSPALVPSKSSLRAIQLNRLVDSIETEIDMNGDKNAFVFYNKLKNNNNLKEEITKREINVLGYNYMMVGKQNEAALVFEMSLDIYPNWFLTYAFMGRNMHIANKPNEALKYYKKALELNDKFESLKPIIKELEAME